VLGEGLCSPPANPWRASRLELGLRNDQIVRLYTDDERPFSTEEIGELFVLRRQRVGQILAASGIERRPNGYRYRRRAGDDGAGA
jgi:hypothetical protein